jgi:hypothetical protein
MWKKTNIVMLLSIIFLSCSKDNSSVKNADIINEEKSKNQASTGLVYHTEEEKIKALLLSKDELAIELASKDEEITFIKKINFGIPAGDTWLTEWNHLNRPFTRLLLYLIRDDIIIKYYNLGMNYNKEWERIQSQFDIMNGIPGTHIGNGTSSIGDFNGDGLDELFQYIFSGMGNFIFIQGYDKGKDDKILYCDIPFDLIDPKNGPAPVEFISYKGINGFKVYYLQLSVAEGPGYVPEPMPDNNKWFFYTWNVDRREYVRVEEIEEET